MAYTVSDVTERCRQHQAGFYPDDQLDANGDILALQVVNEAHSEIGSRCEMFDEETLTTLLVAGQALYPFDPTIDRVNSVLYRDGATSSRVLTPTSLDKLDRSSRFWRVVQPGTPMQWYIAGTKLGLYLTPNRTSVGGYPCVELHVVRPVPFVSMSDTLPPMLPNLDAYVFGALARWALRNAPDQAADWGRIALASTNALVYFLTGRQVHNNPVARPSVVRFGNP